MKDREFIILWVSGVEKIKIVNLFFIASIIIVIVYLYFKYFFNPWHLINQDKN